MKYVSLGSLGFLIAYLFDLVSLRRIPYAKQAIGLTAAMLIGVAHIMVCRRGERLPLPARSAWLGWPLFGLGTLAAVYSLYLEIPFKKTYVSQGVGDQLVTSGTYALTRHPGVLWYALMLVGLVLGSRRRLALAAAPLWLFLDVVWVWLQERFFFRQMFPGYVQYQQETPMLIPTRRSISRCLQSLGGARREA